MHPETKLKSEVDVLLEKTSSLVSSLSLGSSIPDTFQTQPGRGALDYSKLQDDIDVKGLRVVIDKSGDVFRRRLEETLAKINIVEQQGIKAKTEAQQSAKEKIERTIEQLKFSNREHQPRVEGNIGHSGTKERGPEDTNTGRQSSSERKSHRGCDRPRENTCDNDKSATTEVAKIEVAADEAPKPEQQEEPTI